MHKQQSPASASLDRLGSLLVLGVAAGLIWQIRTRHLHKWSPTYNRVLTPGRLYTGRGKLFTRPGRLLPECRLQSEAS